MRAFSILTKQMLKSLRLSLPLLLGVVFLAGYHVLVILVTTGSYGTGYLFTVFHYPILFLTLFLFLSYEYFNSAYAANLAETVEATPHGKRTLTISQLIIMLGAAALFALIMSAFHIFFYISDGAGQPAYLVHILLSVLLNIFLVSVVGVFGGLAAALWLPRLAAYAVLALFVFLTSPVLQGILVDSPLYAVYEWFHLYPQVQGMPPNPSFGYSLQPYRWAVLSLWIALFGGIALLRLCRETVKRWLSIGLCLVLFAISAGVLLQPTSKYDISPHYSLIDGQYYTSHEAKTQAPLFSATNYELDVRIGNQIHVEATATVDQGNLPEYIFTLYHEYKIKEITDQNGTPLPYQQDGDYLTVTPQTSITAIRFVYQGYSPVFYSNSQGTYLSGAFAYYPRPGFWMIFDRSDFSYVTRNEYKPTNYRVTVHSKKQVYCNLPTQADGSFEGTTNGVILYSGFLEETEVDNIRVVWPYMSWFIPDIAAIQASVHDLTQSVTYRTATPLRSIFCVPDNGSGNYTPIYGDTMELGGILSLKHDYAMEQILPQKRWCYSVAVQFYQEIPLEFQSILSREQAADYESERIAQPMTQAIAKYGEPYVREAILTYLFDNQDTRSSEFFFWQLMEKGE